MQHQIEKDYISTQLFLLSAQIGRQKWKYRSKSVGLTIALGGCPARKSPQTTPLNSGVDFCTSAWFDVYDMNNIIRRDDYLIDIGVKEEQFIPIARNNTYVKSHNLDELSKYIRPQIVGKDMYHTMSGLGLI